MYMPTSPIMYMPTSPLSINVIFVCLKKKRLTSCDVYDVENYMIKYSIHALRDAQIFNMCSRYRIYLLH